jgi:hypothetical protein
VNAAYQRLKEFLDAYRFRLEDTETTEDVEQWWQERFYTGVWGRPPKEHRGSQDKASEVGSDGAKTGKRKRGSRPK